ncbi:MAG: hypothetical protein EAZ07_05745 [Cytophagales bacterium]|nr:MAG: hypothetical protein EAZ07_05745 [Cytophagales bacterium]
MQKSSVENDKDWIKLIDKLHALFGKSPDINAILFLIGVQEIGKGRDNYSKEQKQELMHVGMCTILCTSGYYELIGKDKEGWPIFKELKKLPLFDLNEQEIFIKTHIKEYFSNLE